MQLQGVPIKLDLFALWVTHKFKKLPFQLCSAVFWLYFPDHLSRYENNVFSSPKLALLNPEHLFLQIIWKMCIEFETEKILSWKKSWNTFKKALLGKSNKKFEFCWPFSARVSSPENSLEPSKLYGWFCWQFTNISLTGTAELGIEHS